MLKSIFASGMLLCAFTTHANAAPCSTYFSSYLYGSTPGNSQTVVHGPFTINCEGSFSGSIQRLSSASMYIELEKLVGGSWVKVTTGYVSYNGTAGTYRFVVRNISANSGDWKVDYRNPIY